MTDKMATLIRKGREKAKLSQLELARALDFTTAQYISNIERGKSPLSPGHFASVAKLIRVPINSLFRAHVADYETKLKDKVGCYPK